MPRRFRPTAACACALTLLCLLASAETPERPLRPSDLLESPQRFLNHAVEVEIVERLNGVGGDPRAQLCVSLPEMFPCVLSLVAPAPLTAPVRVRGEFQKDDTLTREMGQPGYVIRVSSAEALPAEEPIPVASVADLLAQRERFDRRRIVIEGTWRRGFEISDLDGEIWVNAGGAEVVGTPKKKEGSGFGNRVRLTGLLFARPGSRYGHMGGAAMSLLASKVEYLGPGTRGPHED
jgi:hypothetical protein